MNRTTIIVTVGLAFAATLTTHPAEAQNPRSFVSGQGIDGNACTLAAPCRTFAAAILKTNAGGEIITLNPAGYGSVTIDKSISIVSSLGVGGVNLLAPGNAITINAGVNDIVSLRGLTIDGLGLGSTGIQFNTGKSLTIANCVVRNLTGSGIVFQPNAASNLAVSNTFISKVGSRGVHVTLVPGSTVTINAVLNRVEVYDTTGIGILAQGTSGVGGTINLAVTDSVSSGNTQDGIRAVSLSGPLTTLTVIRSLASGNDTGITVETANATMRIAQSTVTGNAHGWVASNSGVIESYQDNYINGNGTNTGVLTPIGKQ